MTDQKYTPADDDIGGMMAKLSEELGEAQSALAKSMRWGFQSCNPDVAPELQVDNRAWLFAEMKDVEQAWTALANAMANMHPEELHELEPRFQDRARRGEQP